MYNCSSLAVASTSLDANDVHRRKAITHVRWRTPPSSPFLADDLRIYSEIHGLFFVSLTKGKQNVKA